MTFLLRSLFGAGLVCLLLGAGRADGQAGELAEFRQRQTATFNSAGHAKSNGLEISLRYPRSWRAGEGARPHIVQNFLAPPGVPANCNLLILASGPGLTEAQVRASVEPRRAAEQLPANAENVRSQATTIDGLPAAELIFDTTVNRAGLTMRARLVIYITSFRTNLVQLTCLAGGANPSEMAARFGAYQPVFRLIASSLVVHNRWR